MAREGTLHLRNVYVLLGITVTAVSIVYFATEFIDRLSDWGRVMSLGLLTVVFVALGRHFEEEGEPTEVSGARGLRWLRVESALYVLGIVSAFTAVIVFLGIDDLDPLVKLAATFLVGIGLIVWAARRYAPPRGEAE